MNTHTVRFYDFRVGEEGIVGIICTRNPFDVQIGPLKPKHKIWTVRSEINLPRIQPLAQISEEIHRQLTNDIPIIRKCQDDLDSMFACGVDNIV